MHLRIGFLLTFILPALCMGADPVGLIVSSRGNAVLVRDGETPAVMGMQVFVGDRLKTGRDALLSIRFIDNSTFSLAGDADVSIRDFVYGEGKEPRSHLSVSKGQFFFLAGKIAKIAPENYRIETDTATIGIRGSGGEGSYFEGRLHIQTIPGHVLDIRTVSGEHHVLDHYALGLVVLSSGRGIPWAVGSGEMPVFPVGKPFQPQLPASKLHRTLPVAIRRTPGGYDIVRLERANDDEEAPTLRCTRHYEQSQGSSAVSMLARQEHGLELGDEVSVVKKEEKGEEPELV